MTTTVATTETLGFNAEVSKLLRLVIHALYTNREIFLRELISNASDACDKLRYLAQSDASLLEGHPPLGIRLAYDKAQRILTVEDSGIGMSREELIENLGTVARSGTERFLASLTGDQAKDKELIGQFGVGFYASFMVADRVTVHSRRIAEDASWEWTSTGEEDFTVAPSAEPMEHAGTKIILHMKDDSLDFLDQFRLRHIVKTYSDHTRFPVSLTNEAGNTEVITTNSALWTKAKNEITPEEYQAFYRSVAFAGDVPWITIHNRQEGVVEYTNLLFVPTQKPFDLFHPDRKTRVKLYIKRVFVADEAVPLLPAFLRFVRGVVDAQDLPLNISRETLQHNAIIDKIRQSMTKRILSEIKKKAEDDHEGFRQFWENFGPVLKEGLCEGSEHRDALLDICCFDSTSQTEPTTLKGYIERMKPGQEIIYYLSGDTLENLRRSPELETLMARGIEVLLFHDTVDDFWVNVVPEYQTIPLHSITRANLSLPGDAPAEDKAEKDSSSDDETSAKETRVSPVLAYMQRVLAGQLRDVVAARKLVKSPVCLSASEEGMDLRMERYLLEQRQLHSPAQKILEVNEHHPIVQHLAETLQHHPEGTDETERLVWVLFDQACILSGEPLPDRASFADRLNHFLEHYCHEHG